MHVFICKSSGMVPGKPRGPVILGAGHSAHQQVFTYGIVRFRIPVICFLPSTKVTECENKDDTMPATSKLRGPEITVTVSSTSNRSI